MYIYTISFIFERIVLLLDKIIFKEIDQQRNPVPSHFTALMVKVKVHILDALHLQPPNQLFKCYFDGFLVTLLVHQVYQNITSIQLRLFLKMLSRWANLQSG